MARTTPKTETGRSCLSTSLELRHSGSALGTPDLQGHENAVAQDRDRSNWSLTQAEPLIFRCEHHLLTNSLRGMARYGLDQSPAALVKLDKAFLSPQRWAAFDAAGLVPSVWARGSRIPTPRCETQDSWRARLAQYHSNGAVGTALVTTKAGGDHHVMLRNKFLMNQLLELVRAHINHQADAATFARRLYTSHEAKVTTERQLSCAGRGTRSTRVNGVLKQAVVVSSLRRKSDR